MEQLAELMRDEWIIILVYQVISNQGANVFNFMLPAWVRALLSTANYSSHQQILEQELHM